MIFEDNRAGSEEGQGDPAGDVVARDTIFAPSTAPGAAGVAVIRVSGPEADAALRSLTRGRLPEHRVATVMRLIDTDGDTIDEALVLRFAAGGSFTGEATVELQCHGSRAVVSRLMDQLGTVAGLRIADPGEFTRRAFENGRMNLAEAEALGDLVTAETEVQRQQAMSALGAGAVMARWRGDLVHALALIEVSLDWADEDVPEDVSPEVGAIVEDLEREMTTALDVCAAAEKVRSGFEIALVGAPNAGKSSLINYLAGREAAITSPLAGTTRDIIELRYDLGGLPVAFLDMAGLRPDVTDPVEALGVDRARARAAAADVRVFLDAPDAALGALDDGLFREGDVVVRSKADIGSGDVSVRSGAGISELLRRIETVLFSRVPPDPLVCNARQAALLREAHDDLVAARCLAEPELKAEAIRRVIAVLDRILGIGNPEAVLDRVFRQFCLGK